MTGAIPLPLHTISWREQGQHASSLLQSGCLRSPCNSLTLGGNFHKISNNFGHNCLQFEWMNFKTPWAFVCCHHNYTTHSSQKSISVCLFFFFGITVEIFFFILVCFVFFHFHGNQIQIYNTSERDRNSSVGIVTRYGLDDTGIESPWGRDFPCLSTTAPRPTQPPIQ